MDVAVDQFALYGIGTVGGVAPLGGVPDDDGFDSSPDLFSFGTDYYPPFAQQQTQQTQQQHQQQTHLQQAMLQHELLAYEDARTAHHHLQQQAQLQRLTASPAPPTTALMLDIFPNDDSLASSASSSASSSTSSLNLSTASLNLSHRESPAMRLVSASRDIKPEPVDDGAGRSTDTSPRPPPAALQPSQLLQPLPAHGEQGEASPDGLPMHFSLNDPVMVASNGGSGTNSGANSPTRLYNNGQRRVSFTMLHSPSGSGDEDAGSTQLRRQERNRAAARRSREKKKEYLQELENASQSLIQKNLELIKTIRRLHRELAACKGIQYDPNEPLDVFTAKVIRRKSISLPAAAVASVQQQQQQQTQTQLAMANRLAMRRDSI